MTKHIKGKGLWVLAVALLIGAALVTTGVYAAGMDVTADPVTINVNYPKVYHADWLANASGKVKTLTLNVTAGNVTTAQAISTNSGFLKIQLLDSAATIISQGCANNNKNGSTIIDVIPDVALSSVNKVIALGVAAC